MDRNKNSYNLTKGDNIGYVFGWQKKCWIKYKTNFKPFHVDAFEGKVG